MDILLSSIPQKGTKKQKRKRIQATPAKEKALFVHSLAVFSQDWPVGFESGLSRHFHLPCPTLRHEGGFSV